MEADILTLENEVATKVAKSEPKKEEKVFTALCTNCDERMHCRIRNNTAVIWHCEEYR